MATRRQRQAAQRAAREETERRRVAEDAVAGARRRRRALVGACAAALIAIAAALVLVLRGGGGEPSRASAPPATRASTSELGGIPQDGLVLGDDKAPYTLVEFSDLVCPGCKVYAEEILPRVIERYVRSGQLRIELRPIGFVRNWSTLAAQYAWAAAEQDKLWAFVKTWYANQGSEDVDYVDDAFARRIAASVPALDPEQLIRDAGRASLRAKLDQASRVFLTLGFEQVPAFAAGRTGEPLRPIDLGSSPQTASAAISQLIHQ